MCEKKDYLPAMFEMFPNLEMLDEEILDLAKSAYEMQMKLLNETYDTDEPDIPTVDPWLEGRCEKLHSSAFLFLTKQHSYFL